MPLVPIVRRQHWPLAATQRGPVHSSMANIIPIPAAPISPSPPSPAAPAAPAAPSPAACPARLVAANRANPPGQTEDN